MLRQIAHRVHESEGAVAVAWIEIARDDGAGPAADAAHDGDVLLAVGAAVGDRLADDSRRGLELPQRFSTARVDGFEPAVHRAVEHDVAFRRERTAPDGKVLADHPHLPRRDRIPRGEFAAMSAGT